MNQYPAGVLRRIVGGLLLVAPLAAPVAARAQQITSPPVELPARCATVHASALGKKAVPPEAKREAEQLAGRAQAASIQGDNAVAVDLYARAATVDPTNAGVAYALGRGYEAAHDARAMDSYCQFLALAPAAPEASDVRQRIAELTLALPAADVAATAGGSTSESDSHAATDAPPSPTTALLSGLIVPGLGQIENHSVVPGILVMAAAAGAVFWGLQTQAVNAQVTHTAIDPLGHSYQYQTTELQTQRPYMAVGLASAATISVFAALQAFSRARGDFIDAKAAAVRSSATSAPVLSFGARSIAINFGFR
ncbi:MAG: hypothetical protein M3R65_07735 [Gemmatimonadota bacterium]|nr:hypothetical protein [Gemmatimonadota bacterium]